MKKYKKLLILPAVLLAAGMGMTSCDLDLAPIDYYGSEGFWKTEAQAKGNLTAIMEQCRSSNELFSSIITFGEMRGGAYTLEDNSSDVNSLNGTYIVMQNLSETNYGVSNFGDYWGIIANLNLYINRVSDADYFSSEEERDYTLGMAYGMRAYYYFIMYRAYGGVPLRLGTEVVDGNYDATSLYKGRAKASEVVAQIQSDIDKSIELFGSQTNFDFNGSSSNSKYYWSKAATEMLAGEFALWISKVATGDQAIDKSQLSVAKTHFQNVINNYGLSLQSTFSSVFSTSNKQNSEIIYAYKHDEQEVTNQIPIYYTYNTVTGSSIGKCYDINGNLFADDLLLGSVGQPRYQFSNALWYQYDAEDTRRDVTFVATFHDQAAQQLRGTFPIKFIGSVSSATGYRCCDADQPVFRLAEAYLALAEIANMQGDNAAVKENIDIIRQRAYGNNWDATKYGYTPGTFTENEVAILHEKDKEFVQEGQRWYDVRRMSVSTDCADTDHLVFHNEGSICYGIENLSSLKEESGDSWEKASQLTLQPILSTSLAYRVLWPVDASTLNNDAELGAEGQTPGYETSVGKSE